MNISPIHNFLYLFVRQLEQDLNKGHVQLPEYSRFITNAQGDEEKFKTTDMLMKKTVSWLQSHEKELCKGDDLLISHTRELFNTHFSLSEKSEESKTLTALEKGIEERYQQLKQTIKKGDLIDFNELGIDKSEDAYNEIVLLIDERLQKAETDKEKCHLFEALSLMDAGGYEKLKRIIFTDKASYVKSVKIWAYHSSKSDFNTQKDQLKLSTSEKQRIQLWHWANSDPNTLLKVWNKHQKKISPEDQVTLLKLAAKTSWAIQPIWNAISLGNINLESMSLKQRIDLLKALFGNLTLSRFSRMAPSTESLVKDENERVEFMSVLGRLFQEFHFTNREMDQNNFLKFLTEFLEIKTPAQKKALAILLVKNGGVLILIKSQLLGITDPLEIEEIISHFSSSNAKDLSRFWEALPTRSLPMAYLLLTKAYGEAIPKDLNLEKEEDRFQLALAVAQLARPLDHPWKDYTVFNLTEKTHLEKLARVLAKTEPKLLTGILTVSPYKLPIPADMVHPLLNIIIDSGEGGYLVDRPYIWESMQTFIPSKTEEIRMLRLISRQGFWSSFHVSDVTDYTQYQQVPLVERLALYRDVIRFKVYNKPIQQLFTSKEKGQMDLETHAFSMSDETIEHLPSPQEVSSTLPWMTPCSEKAEKETNPVVRKQMMDWLIYAVGLFSERPQPERLKTSGILETIFSLKDPSLRFHLTRKLRTLTRSDPKILNLKWFQKEKLLLPAILLASFEQQGIDIKEIEGIAQQIEKNRAFQDARKLAKLLHFINELLDDPQLNPKERFEILNNVFKAKNSETQLRWMRSCRALHGIVGGKLLMERGFVKSVPRFNELFQEIFTETFTIGDVKNIAEKYEKSILKFRDNRALFTLAGSLNDYPESKELLSRFVEDVLEGRFPASRYSDENNEHLRTVFQSQKQLKEKWRQSPKQKTLSGITKEDDTPPPILNMVLFLEELSKEEVKSISTKLLHFNMIIKNMHDRNALNTLQQSISKKIKTCKKGSQEAILLHFKRSLINLCRGNLNAKQMRNEVNKMRENSQKISGITPLTNLIEETLPDLEERIEWEQNNQYTISETDQDEDLLLAGTEIIGSCIRVDNTLADVQGLLALIMDGKNRIIAIKNNKGKIIARSILRLLWGPDAKTPILFLEKIYNNHNLKQFDNAIEKWAIARAKSLNLPLTSRHVGTGKPYPGLIASLGGPAPFEYSDATGGLQENSEYTITMSHLIETT